MTATPDPVTVRTWRARTVYLILAIPAVFVLYCFYDFAAYTLGTNEATVSREVFEWTWHSYLWVGLLACTAFLGGVLVGHFRFPQTVYLPASGPTGT